MEADWSVEIGADLPVIVVPWDGFVNLLGTSALILSVKEAAMSSALTQALAHLNREASPVFTSKCDFWLLNTDEIGPLEFDALPGEANQGMACYIDIIARRESLFTSFAKHEKWVRSAADDMRRAELRQARADLVVRPANVNERDGFAVTLYVAACGATSEAAGDSFSAALQTAATVTMKLAAAGE